MGKSQYCSWYLLLHRVIGIQSLFESIEQIDYRIDVASVLAELSFLIEDRIVLNKVELVAEKFPDKKQDKALPDRSAVVRAVRVNVDRKQQLPLGHVRFKVVISGVAADASDVAALICRLEDSPYFFQVVLSFSRSAELKVESILPASGGTPKTGADITVSEFEIHCDLGNYRLQ